MEYRPAAPDMPVPNPDDFASTDDEQDPYDFGSDVNEWDDEPENASSPSPISRSLPPLPTAQPQSPPAVVPSHRPLPPPPAASTDPSPPNVPTRAPAKQPNIKKEESTPNVPPRRVPDPHKKHSQAPKKYDRSSDVVADTPNNKPAPQMRVPPRDKPKSVPTHPVPTPVSPQSHKPTKVPQFSAGAAHTKKLPAALPPVPKSPTPAEEEVYSLVDDDDENIPAVHTEDDDESEYIAPAMGKPAASAGPITVSTVAGSLQSKISALHNLEIKGPKVSPRKLPDEPTPATSGHRLPPRKLPEKPTTAGTNTSRVQGAVEAASGTPAINEIMFAKSRLKKPSVEKLPITEPKSPTAVFKPSLPTKPAVPPHASSEVPKPPSPTKNRLPQPLELCGWYHGKIDRQEGERRVSVKDGHFLVRDASGDNTSQPYTLVVYCKKLSFNLKIRKVGNSWAVGEAKVDTEEKMHDSVIDLIEFHKKNEIKLFKKGRPEMLTCLLDWPKNSS